MSQNFHIANQEELIQVLNHVLSGDNTKIQEATKYLRVYTKMKESIGPLLMIIMTQQPQLKQLAAVLMKKHIMATYDDLSNLEQVQLKQTLLKCFFEEQVNVVRVSIGNVIGNLATVTLNTKNWPELLYEISQRTNENNTIEQRRGGLILLGLILESCGEYLTDFYEEFTLFFLKSINDQNPIIRKETLKCLVYLFSNHFEFKDNHVKKIQQLIDPMLLVLDQTIKDMDDDLTILCFDSFNLLVETNSKILDNHYQMLLQYICSDRVLLNRDITKQIKETMFDFIFTITDHKRKVLSMNIPLLKQVLECLFTIICVPVNQDDLESDEQSLQDIAIQLVEQFACNLPKKKVYKVLMENISFLIKTGDPNKMNAGFLVLGGICEGCMDQLRNDLPVVLMKDLIPLGLQHQSPIVRGACIMSLSYMCDYLHPDILNYHQVVMPELVKNLHDSNLKVGEKALISIDLFCENLESKVNQYLQILLPNMVQVIMSQQATPRMKQIAVGCIGSCAWASKSDFKIYMPDVSKILNELVFMKCTPETIPIQAEAIQSLGKISSNVCKQELELFKQYIQPVMEHIYIMMTNNNEVQIREAGLQFFYNIAETIGSEFHIFLDKLIDFTLKIASSNEGLEKIKSKKEEFSLDTDSDDELGNAGANVKQTYLDEKAAAIHAIGCFAQACPVQFAPYFEKTLAVLEDCHNYFYENIRVQAVDCYKNITEAMVKCFNNGVLPEFTKGILVIKPQGLPVVKRLNPKIEQFLQIELMSKMLYYLESEDSSEVVCMAIESLDSLAKSLGPILFENCLQDLTNQINVLLKGQGRCQIPVDEDEDEEDDETNIEVYESLVDLIPSLCKVCKVGFQQHFFQLLPSMMIYTKETRDINDNIQIVGCLGQCFNTCPQLLNQSAQVVMQYFLKTDSLADEGLNRNTVFAFGCMAKKNPQVMQPYLNQILFYIKNTFENCQMPDVKDNCIASLCKLIMVDQMNAIPLQGTLDNIFKHIPFKGDEEENISPVKFIFWLCQNIEKYLNLYAKQILFIESEFAQQYLDKILEYFLICLINNQIYKIKEKHCFKIGEIIKNIAQIADYQKKIENQIVQFNQNQQNILMKYLN